MDDRVHSGTMKIVRYTKEPVSGTLFWALRARSLFVTDPGGALMGAAAFIVTEK